ncbi:hypothetical protein ACC674_39340, partial [Rhizobium ruizarguesonis]
MTDTQWDAAIAKPCSIYWKRNLTISLIGSFTTIVAMTLLLPFLPLYVEELGAGESVLKIELFEVERIGRSGA